LQLEDGVANRAWLNRDIGDCLKEWLVDEKM